MKKILQALIVSALFFAPTVAVSEGVTGFQGFNFGMSQQEAAALQPLSFRSEEDKGRWYRSAEQVTIQRNSYFQDLLFSPDNRLVQVNVSREFAGNDHACTLEFNSVYGAVRARYGDPDQQPSRSVHGGISSITSARFTQANGSWINVAAIWLNNCSILVAYVSSPGDTGF